MESNDDMRNLVNDLFRCFYSGYVALSEETTLNSPNPINVITSNFLQNIRAVMLTKLMMMQNKWETFLEMNFYNMLSSHEIYLRYVMSACGFEDYFAGNIFNRVLSVCALVINFNIETLKNTGVNFCELTSDIFMEFYDSVLKEPFYREGGMEQLVEYVNRHECLTWKWYWKDVISAYAPDIFVARIQNDLGNKILKELANEPCFPEVISQDHVLSHPTTLVLAQKVLSCTRNRLPTMPSSDDLKGKLHIMIQEKAAILRERKRRAEIIKADWHLFSRSNFDSGANSRTESE